VTFQSAAYAVDGNSESGNFLRLMLQSATLGSQGIIFPTDLLVTQTGVASSGIIINSGACVVFGAETPFQGSYFGYNVGNDTSLTIAATGGSIRSDMIVVRAEDPTWSGTPWGNPASGQILFPRVISGVSGTATQAPGGISAIPLARIDIPVSTSTITNAMIHDLRFVCNPQRILQMGAANGPGSPQAWTVGTSGVIWPTTATFSIAIPTWATVMQFQWEFNDILWNSGVGTQWARGFINPFFGTNVAAPNLSMPQTLVSIPLASGPYRHSISGAFAVAIPPALRGTTQTLNFKQVTDGTQTGTLSADEGSSYAIMYEFQQLASAT
jgi:hypothetical protein